MLRPLIMIASTYKAMIRQTADVAVVDSTTFGATTVEVSPLATVQVITRPWWKILGVKFAIVYIQAFLGALAWDSRAFTNIGDMWSHVGFAASVALATAAFAMVQKLGEFLTKLDMTHPEWTS